MSDIILVPIDGSQGALKALAYAIELIQKRDGQIMLLNVQPNFSTPNTKMFFGKKDIEEYTEMMASEALQAAKKIAEESGVPYQVKVRVGSAKEEICQEAKELAAYTIVMGQRGLGAIMRAVMGSVSFGVLQEPPCPVTIVP